MALYKLDPTGKPIKTGSRKKPAQDEHGRLHWRYQVRKSKKHPKDITRHFWAHEDEVWSIVDAFHSGKTASTASGLTWSEAFKRWQDGHPQISSNHISTIERNIKYLCDFSGNDTLTIEDTSKGLFREWLNERAKVSVATANKSREILAVAKYAWQHLDLIDAEPPCLSVGKFRGQSAKRRALDISEIPAYLDAAKTHYGEGLALIVEFLLFTGVRSTEATQIKDSDIADTGLTIWQKSKGAGKREALVVMDNYIAGIISRARKHKAATIKRLKADAKAKREAGQDTTAINRQIKAATGSFIFINNSGTSWTKDTLRRRWQAVCGKAGLEYIKPHELRHTHATLAGEAGFSERYLQAAMRWDDPTMARRYVHETENMAKKVAGAVRKKLSETINPDKKNSRNPSTAVSGLSKPAEIICPCCGKTIGLTPKK